MFRNQEKTHIWGYFLMVIYSFRDFFSLFHCLVFFSPLLICSYTLGSFDANLLTFSKNVTSVFQHDFLCTLH